MDDMYKQILCGVLINIFNSIVNRFLEYLKQKDMNCYGIQRSVSDSLGVSEEDLQFFKQIAEEEIINCFYNPQVNIEQVVNPDEAD